MGVAEELNHSNLEVGHVLRYFGRLKTKTSKTENYLVVTVPQTLSTVLSKVESRNVLDGTRFEFTEFICIDPSLCPFVSFL